MTNTIILIVSLSLCFVSIVFAAVKIFCIVQEKNLLIKDLLQQLSEALSKMDLRISGAIDNFQRIDVTISELSKTVAEHDEVMNSDTIIQRIENLEATNGIRAIAAEPLYVNRDRSKK